MTKRATVLALFALGLTAACDYADSTIPTRENQIFAGSPMGRGFAHVWSEYPFEYGALDIVATESGQMRSFRLTPCRGGEAICAGGLNGPAGTLTQTPDYWIVRGLYQGRTFYLSPGGDGAIHYGAERAAALAWNNIG